MTRDCGLWDEPSRRLLLPSGIYSLVLSKFGHQIKSTSYLANYKYQKLYFNDGDLMIFFRMFYTVSEPFTITI